MRCFPVLAKALLPLGLIVLQPLPARAGWRQAAPGWAYRFPADEFSHPDFKTEWWYFTGHLREEGTGRPFGYQLTFFRQGVRPPGSRTPARSGFVTDHFWFAHLAVSDLASKRFHATERVSRGAFKEAGSGPGEGDRLVWIGDWTLRQPEGESGRYQVAASSAEVGLELDLSSSKPPVFHGKGGVSAKSPDAGNASHYFSHTRLATSGQLRVGERSFQVEGQSWFDREWSTSVLGEGITGWDWFSIQLEGNTEIMLFRLRDASGKTAYSSGTLIAADGGTRSLADGGITFEPLSTWTSPRGKATYPVEWRVAVPEHGIDLRVRAAMPDQELRLAAITYWEGATEVAGERSGKPVGGQGYLEMTGYASGLAGLR